MKSLEYSPIGYFRCSSKHKYEASRQPSDDESDFLGVVELNSGLENFIQALKGLDGFERIWIIYEFHKNQHWNPMTNTPRATKKQGVFATRAPYRPNPIGMSCVKLVSVKGLKIIVKEFDLLDETPILDIKPYIPSCDSFDVRNRSWLEENSLKSVEYTDLALEKLSWLIENGELMIKSFIEDQLKRDPLNKQKKRVKKIRNNIYCLSFRMWRVHFEYSEEKEISRVFDIYSGCDEESLLKNENKIHKEFNDYKFLQHKR